MDDRTERPILFSAPMVKALLAGTKTQTRRVIKPQPPAAVTRADLVLYPADGRSAIVWCGDSFLDPLDGTEFGGSYKDRNQNGWRCPYGTPGGKLWVRESGWERPERTPKMMRAGADTWPRFAYAADDWSEDDRADFKRWGFKVRPSIHMPRWASRILLEITAIRVERLNDISEADAKAEGITEGPGDFAGCFTCGPVMSGTTAVECYSRLWDAINGPGSWAANPWVWGVGFQRVKS